MFLNFYIFIPLLSIIYRDFFNVMPEKVEFATYFFKNYYVTSFTNGVCADSDRISRNIT